MDPLLAISIMWLMLGVFLFLMRSAWTYIWLACNLLGWAAILFLAAVETLSS